MSHVELEDDLMQDDDLDTTHDIDDLDDTQLESMIPSFAPMKSQLHTITQAAATHSSRSSHPSQQPQAQTQLSNDSYIRLHVPSHRYSALTKHWMEIYEPIVNSMKLLIRYNPKQRVIELKTGPMTDNPAALSKTADFLKAFLLGFEVGDALALLRLDDIFLDSFDVKDVKMLSGEHLSRAIGRIAGVNGKTKFTIENATRTRVVIANTQIHILGSYSNITPAKNALVRLILGAPPSKVYTQMRAVAARQKERF